MSESVRIGTRRSALARAQAQWAATRLEQAGARAEIIAIDTRGDRDIDTPLPEIGAKGLFTRELEEMLADGRIDIAVHSLKDLPGENPDGLIIGAITTREDPRDCIVSRDGHALDALPTGARIGTGSVRRAAQLRALRSDIELAPIRGNVPTRIERVERGDFDATILAAAGLSRLGLSNRISEALAINRFVPAPGQGALGIQCREDDPATLALLDALRDADAETACRAERIVQSMLSGGCSAPVGIHATADRTFTMTVFVGTPDGRTSIRETIRGPLADWESLANELGERVIGAGAAQILEDARRRG